MKTCLNSTTKAPLKLDTISEVEAVRGGTFSALTSKLTGQTYTSLHTIVWVTEVFLKVKHAIVPFFQSPQMQLVELKR